MAYADYRLCAACEGKAFYDAEVDSYGDSDVVAVCRDCKGTYLAAALPKATLRELLAMIHSELRGGDALAAWGQLVQILRNQGLDIAAQNVAPKRTLDLRLDEWRASEEIGGQLIAHQFSEPVASSSLDYLHLRSALEFFDKALLAGLGGGAAMICGAAEAALACAQEATLLRYGVKVSARGAEEGAR